MSMKYEEEDILTIISNSNVYSRECTCSVCCHEFDTRCTGSELVRFHWHVSSREKLMISR